MILSRTIDEVSELIESIKRPRDYAPTPNERALVLWFQRAANLRGVNPAKMAAYLRRRAMETGYRTNIRLGPDQLEEAGIPRATAYEALRELANAGLINLVPNRRRMVSILEVDEDCGECSTDKSNRS